MASIRAKDIISCAKENISSYFPTEIYRVRFVPRKGNHPGTNIIINNNKLLPPTNQKYRSRNFDCLECEIFEDPPILHIELLTRCGLNGTHTLNQLIAFSEACGFSQIKLKDESGIEYEAIDGSTHLDHTINLQYLLRLTIGQSWYEQFGFTNPMIQKHKSAIDVFIQEGIGTIYPEELLLRLQNYDSRIKYDTSVKDAVLYLSEYLKVLCPNRKCNSKDKLAIVYDINGILRKMYWKGLHQRLGTTDTDFHDLYLMLPRKQQGSSRKTRHKKVNRTRRRKRTRRSRISKIRK
jgi:hypothetical protein